MRASYIWTISTYVILASDFDSSGSNSGGDPLKSWGDHQVAAPVFPCELRHPCERHRCPSCCAGRASSSAAPCEHRHGHQISFPQVENYVNASIPKDQLNYICLFIVLRLGGGDATDSAESVHPQNIRFDVYLMRLWIA